ncbi:MAG: tetratricopeptide repeat protein [Dehalococcoidia bacterium]
MTTLPSGTVTFLFTDIESSTPLSDALGAHYADVLDQHLAILRRSIAAHDGFEFKTVGDEMCAAFARATDAIAAAVDAQRGMLQHGWPEEGIVRVRMGIHTGEPIVRGDDYVGLELAKAKRTEDAAHGGQILVSESSARASEDSLPDTLTLRDLGEHRLKGLSKPTRLFQITCADLPSDFPPPRSLDRYINNLPVAEGELIGREREISFGLEAVAEPKGLILTVTGPAGVGKTALALSIAHRARPQFANGACFVDLAQVSEAGDVPHAVGQALGFTNNVGSNPEDLVRYLQDRRLILLLDNFEQVTGAVPFVTRIAGQCRGVQVLVTSRERLGASNEQLLPLSGLDLAPEQTKARATEENPAVALFLMRARAVNPQFNPTRDDLGAIAEIVARLDGLPLAIQLAASRAQTLSPQAMRARLSSRLGLAAARRSGQNRHVNLERAIAWSYELLDSETERAAFRMVSIFSGTFGLEAVEAIATRADCGSIGLDALEALVDKSLLVPVRDIGSEPRFRMLETIREFAYAEAVRNDELERMQRATLDYFVDAARSLDYQLVRGNQADALLHVSMELDGFRTSLEIAMALDPQAGLEIASILNPFWFAGNHREGRGWILRLLNNAGDDCHVDSRTRAVAVANRLSNTHAEVQGLLTELDRSVALCRTSGRRFWLATSLNNLGHALVMLGRLDDSLPVLDQAEACAREVVERSPMLATALIGTLGVKASALALLGKLDEAARLSLECFLIAQQSNDVQQMAQALGLRGEIAFYLGDPDEALKFYEEALALLAKIGSRFGNAECLAGCARVELRRGNIDKAVSLARQSLEVSANQPLGFESAWGLAALANIAMQSDQPGRAVSLFASVDALARDAGRFQRSLHAVADAAARKELEATLDREEFRIAWSAGQDMRREEALLFGAA